MRRKPKKSHFLLEFLLLLWITFLVVTVSIGSALFHTSLHLSGEVAMKPDLPIRLNRISISSAGGQAYESYSAMYNVKSITMNVCLPQTSSELVYEVSLKNQSNSAIQITQIVTSHSTNENVIYEISGLNIGDIISANSETLFYVTIHYSSTVSSIPDHQCASYTIDFDWEKYQEETVTYLVDAIYGLTSGHDSTSEDIIEAASGTNCTNQMAYDHSGANLRYVGDTPCNYIQFGNEVWRIIGVFSQIKLQDNVTTTLVKIINPSFSDYQSVVLDNSTNVWANTSLYNTLNTTYWNTLTSAGLDAYVENVYWNVGGLSTSSNPSNFYNAERSSNVSSGSSEVLGHVGLLYPSDYGYSTSSTSSAERQTCISGTASSSSMNNWASSCLSNSWIRNSRYNEWTFTPRYTSKNQAFRITSAGKTTNSTVKTTSAARPVLYLKANVILTGGDGSPSMPYQIASS